MTKKQILEGNKLIAEFMGGKQKPIRYSLVHKPEIFYETGIKRPFGGCKMTADELIYHSSWDWLMPVVGKIESIHDGVSICAESCEIFSFNVKHYDNKFFVEKSKIEATYKAVISFIKWYNHRQLAGKVFPKRKYRSRKNCKYFEYSFACNIMTANCKGVNCGYYKTK
jgi:hypothetical protein